MSSGTSPAPLTVVLFSTADWRAPYPTNKQHTAERLARRGSRVLYIESVGFRRPGVNRRDLRRIVRRLTRAAHGPERLSENLWILAPLTIPVAQRSGTVRRFNGMLLRATIARWIRRHARSRPLIWTYHPYLQGALQGLDRAGLVYHCVDDVAAIPGVETEAYLAAEDRLLAEADLVFTTSPRLQLRSAAIAGSRAIYDSNVADLAHFARARTDGLLPRELAAVPQPRLGYLGVLADYKLDLPLVEASVARHREWQWIFIGEEPEGQSSPIVARLRQQPNVHFLGHRSYRQLPDYLRGIDVALLPNRLDGYMASAFPMKFYEYLAAGRPVVATALPALAGLDGFLQADSDAESFSAAIGRALEAPPPVLTLEDPRLAEHSWDARLDRMLLRIRESCPAAFVG